MRWSRRAMACALAAVAVAAHAGAPGSDPRAAHARAWIEEVARIGPILAWPGFDVTKFPIVLIWDGGAIAAGFGDSPPGRGSVLEGVTFGGGPVHMMPGADPSLSNLRSPARIGDRWAVVAHLPEDDPFPRDDDTGAPSTDETMAGIVADAFTLWLMEERGARAPWAGVPTGYPDDAPLAALGRLEDRVLLDLVRLLNLNEHNIDRYRTLACQLEAVSLERRGRLDPAVAAAEEEFDRWQGLREDARTVLHRLTMQGSIGPGKILLADPWFTGYENGGLLRLLITNYPLLRGDDGPVATSASLSARAAAIGFVLDRLDPLWRAGVARETRSLVAMIGAAAGCPAEGRPGALREAQEAFGYEAGLRLAEAEVAGRSGRRADLLATLLPPEGRAIEIALPGSAILRYVEEPTARLLGEGWVLHEGLDAAGDDFDLMLRPGGIGGTRVLTRAFPTRDRIGTIRVPLPAGARVGQGSGGEIPGVGSPLGVSHPLEVEAPGLRVSITRGRVAVGPAGRIRVDLSDPPASGSK